MLSDDLIALADITHDEANLLVIPVGSYCYKILSIDNQTGRIHIDLCPYHEYAIDKDDQDNGYCTLCNTADWRDGTLLWDMVKECGYNEDLDEDLDEE